MVMEGWMRCALLLFTALPLVVSTASAESSPPMAEVVTPFSDVPDAGASNPEEVWEVDVPWGDDEPSRVELPTVVEKPSTGEQADTDSSPSPIAPEQGQYRSDTSPRRHSDQSPTDTLPVPIDTHDGGCTYGEQPATFQGFLIFLVLCIGMRGRDIAIDR